MDPWLRTQNYAATVTVEIPFLTMTEKSLSSVQQNESDAVFLIMRKLCSRKSDY